MSGRRGNAAAAAAAAAAQQQHQSSASTNGRRVGGSGSSSSGGIPGLNNTRQAEMSFHPRLIATQIVALQSFHYFVLAFCLQINSLLFGDSTSNVTVDRIFTDDYLRMWRREGMPDVLAVLTASFVGYVCSMCCGGGMEWSGAGLFACLLHIFCAPLFFLLSLSYPAFLIFIFLRDEYAYYWGTQGRAAGCHRREEQKVP